MANSSSVQPWALTMPLGSLQQWLFTLTTVNAITGQSAPYPIAGATWEYVVRATPASGGSALISFGTAATSQGVLPFTAGQEVVEWVTPGSEWRISAGTAFGLFVTSPGGAGTQTDIEAEIVWLE